MAPNNEQPVNPVDDGQGDNVPPPVAEPITADQNDKDARLWATLCHVSAFAGFIGIPFGHILGPLIVWLMKRNDFPFVDDQDKESLNFQITLTIYGAIAALLCFVLIGIPIAIALYIGGIVLVIMATIRANHGERYRYPFTIRLLK